MVLDNRCAERDGVVIGGLTSAYVTYYRQLCKDGSYEERYLSRGYKKLCRPAPQLAEADWISKMPQGYRIMLSHHPEYWSSIKDMGVNLMLSGHSNTAPVPRLFNPTQIVYIR